MLQDSMADWLSAELIDTLNMSSVVGRYNNKMKELQLYFRFNDNLLVIE